MKAKDLAALAALGIAGKYAYDKYSEKNAPAKKGEEMPAYKGREANRVADIEAESDERAGIPAYQGRSANRLADIEAEAGEAAMPVAQPRNRVDRSAELQSEFGPKAAAAPAVAVKPVATRSLAPAAVAPAAAQDDYGAETRRKGMQVAPVLPDASRVTPYNPDIMYSDTVPFDTSMPHNDKMNQAAYSRNKRAGVVPSQRPNDQAQARIARQSASASEIAAREAEIARKEKAFKTMATFDPARASSIPLEASQNMSLFKQMRGRAKGGAVKMASGGLASSKMSKPSGASRGDGIAQRGRTRGKYL